MNRVKLFFAIVVVMSSASFAGADQAASDGDKASECATFAFDASDSYDVDDQELTFLWDFGDGDTSTKTVVTHTYKQAGEYVVTLKARDSSDLPCDTAEVSQKISVNTRPIPSFRAPDKACVGMDIVFDASSTSDNTPKTLTYAWDFGDGSKGEAKKTSHKYDKGGTYKITLTVDDNSGLPCNSAETSKSIKVNTRPVANAGEDINIHSDSIDDEYVVAMDGSLSYDPDRDDLSYLWDLGDGNRKQGAKITHTYSRGGDYKVTLVVDDGSGLPCSTASDTLMVSLNKAPVAVLGGDIEICAGTDHRFDASQSRTEEGENLSYEWDFGDGTKSAGRIVSHKYQKGGVYSVILTVDDGQGTSYSRSSDVLEARVNTKPSVKIKKVESICEGERVELDASASNDPDGDKLSYVWDFGDGSKVEGSSKVVHTYKNGGTYNIKVEVDDGRGSICSKNSALTKLKVNTPPIASCTVKKACCVNMEQVFDASTSSDSDGDLLSYMWDFGDGETSEAAKVAHVYKKPGKYKVVLTVDDGSDTRCSEDTHTEYIEVNAKPVPVLKYKQIFK